MEMTLIIATLVLALVSYLLGSISFAVIFTNYYAHTDIRQHGSGNAGMTNVLRTVGKKPAISHSYVTCSKALLRACSVNT